MTKEEKRKNKKEVNLLKYVMTIIKKVFPTILEKLKNLTDKRKQGYVKYDMATITMVRLLGAVCGLTSMNQITNQLNTEEAIKNIGDFLGTELKDIPHLDTINNVFKEINIEELREIQKEMVCIMIERKMLDKYRFKGKYFQIVIDGTQTAVYNHKHCKHCLKKIFNKGQEDERTIYYHYVLEAKLVVGDMVISLDTEFVENEDENVEKQDCEMNAFHRMIKRIKETFPRLPIILSGDALYACEPVMKACKENNWEYITRFKENRIKSLSEEIEGIEEAEDINKNIKYWNNIQYGEVGKEKIANIIKYREDEKKYMWITSFEITEKNYEEIIYFGKQRWRIENEGFKEQKKGTFNIEHSCSEDNNAMKVHYFFIQFAHTIRQLLEKGIEKVRNSGMDKKTVSAILLYTLTYTSLSDMHLNNIQFRFMLT